MAQSQNYGNALLPEQYIKENKAGIEIVYSPEFITMMPDGQADGSFMSPFSLSDYAKLYPNFQLRMIDEVELSGPKGTGDPNTYFWFRPEDQKLRDDVSEVVKKPRDDGTLSRLSLRFAGADYPSRIDAEAEKDLDR